MHKTVSDIKSILHFFKEETTSRKQSMMIDDLESKFTKLQDIIGQRHKFDIIILTIVPIEFQAVCISLNIDIINDCIDRLNGIEYYRASYKTKQNKTVDILVSCVGEAGPANITLVCSRTFEKYTSDLVILTGIAAGSEGRIKHFDCVIAEMVVDYEMQRWNEDKDDEYRNKPYEILRQELYRLIKNYPLYHEHIQVFDNRASLEKIISETYKVDESIVKRDYAVKTGLIASGAKLLADQARFAQLCSHIEILKGVLALDMEGGGFCPMCKEYTKDWVLVRGISDLVIDKNAENKATQIIAAFNAAETTLKFIEYYYKISILE